MEKSKWIRTKNQQLRDELKKILRELRGPIVAPPEVGEDGKLKEKKEVKLPANVELPTQKGVTYPSDYLSEAARPIKEEKETA